MTLVTISAIIITMLTNPNISKTQETKQGAELSPAEYLLKQAESFDDIAHDQLSENIRNFVQEHPETEHEETRLARNLKKFFQVARVVMDIPSHRFSEPYAHVRYDDENAGERIRESIEMRNILGFTKIQEEIKTNPNFSGVSYSSKFFPRMSMGEIDDKKNDQMILVWGATADRRSGVDRLAVPREETNKRRRLNRA